MRYSPETCPPATLLLNFLCGLIMLRSKFRTNCMSVFLSLGSSLLPHPIFKQRGSTKLSIKDSPLLWIRRLCKLELPWTCWSANCNLCSSVKALPKTNTWKYQPYVFAFLSFFKNGLDSRICVLFKKILVHIGNSLIIRWYNRIRIYSFTSILGLFLFIIKMYILNSRNFKKNLIWSMTNILKGKQTIINQQKQL